MWAGGHVCHDRPMVRIGALALIAVMVLAAPARARALRAPATGDWEGRGPHGLALSFELSRTRRGIRADAFTLMRPFGCPATVRSAAASSVARPGYAGPGAAPPALQVPVLARPGTIDISGLLPGSPFPLEVEGALHGPARAVLSTPRPNFKHNACWPRTLRFSARRSHRAAVADGHWTGTLTGTNGATVSVQIDVTARGRMVSSFGFALSCPGDDPASTEPSFSVGPDVNGRFIAANGAFTGALGPTSPVVWHGRFAAGVLTGTISDLGGPCGQDPGALTAVFTATRTA